MSEWETVDRVVQMLRGTVAVGIANMPLPYSWQELMKASIEATNALRTLRDRYEGECPYCGTSALVVCGWCGEAIAERGCGKPIVEKREEGG